MSLTLEDRLNKIKSPNLQSQQQYSVILKAVEETLNNETTPTAYFAALLALLPKAITPQGVVNKDLATSIVYLLDVVTPYTPPALLRAKFTKIFELLALALAYPEADAPLLRPSIGCFESILIAQDGTGWELSPGAIGPRRALAGLLFLAVDRRPKIRKGALTAIKNVLTNAPPSPSVDHPAADMCAESAMKSLTELASQASQSKKQRKIGTAEHEPALIHALQLVKTVADASNGWPSKKIEELCEVLLNISKSNNEYMTIAAFEVFEIIFKGMSDAESSSKLPRLLEVISELRPSQNDTQLLPPWIAIMSRGYDVSSQLEPEETFQKLPELFNMISGFLASSSYNIRESASQCLISFMANCVPDSVILEPSVYDEKILENISKAAVDLLSVKYQAAWKETFAVTGAMFDGLRWQANSNLVKIVQIIGELRGNDSFAGKSEADEVLGKAIRAMGPESVLEILPLNLARPKAGEPGRAWLLPILRDYTSNTNLQHFKSEFLRLSESMYQRVLDRGSAEKTMETKIFETLVLQIWAIFGGYCDLPLDLLQSFDQAFAEQMASLLYHQIDLRSDICKGLQTLIESNKAIVGLEGEDDLVLQSRVTKEQARKNLDHMSTFAPNMLAVLFNVYTQTLPQYRAYILHCINSFLSITTSAELATTFANATSTLEIELKNMSALTQAEKNKQKDLKMPPMSYTLMDLVITMSIYLPRESFGVLFNIASVIIMKDDDPQLQKKSYKLIPRLAESEGGKIALQERNSELQQLLISSASKATAPSKRDRLAAIATLVSFLPNDSLHFIPAILPEIVISCKEINEKARTTAFDLLVSMADKIVAAEGSTIDVSKLENMPDNEEAKSANLDEYIMMVSAGLAGNTPHMISASVTALTRILYHFRSSISPETFTGLLETLDLFLTSNNREIVRSVLGAVKVCVISLPAELMLPRLSSLIANLIKWNEAKPKPPFKNKIKHIIERMIRRYGADVVNKNTPEEHRKLITNIRKTKERTKRQRAEHKAAGGSDDDIPQKHKGRFESEYDEALHGSDEDSEDSDVSDDEIIGKNRRETKKGGETYIVEDEDDPLDLLDRKALGNISSTKPVKQRLPGKKTKAKLDLDGKLLFGDGSDDDDAMILDTAAENGAEPDSVDAYQEAIRGHNAVQRGRGGRLKITNKREKNDEMELDEEDVQTVKKQVSGDSRGSFRGGRGRGGVRVRGGVSAGRRGLGEEKRHGSGGNTRGGGRVMKSPRGRGGARSGRR
ncbi:NUC173 domain-containing protein [Calycina marina]|uniref:NUC173 domain-containing protein n=1 Tax=Calycina marina TaxID=1763456 RepID=A0A9P7ZA77_9HELO|nr:NUC173 domain-containing protein [Calycina marina]